MNKSVEHAISYLERDIAEWENIARFFQQHNATLTDNERVESGEQVAARYRARMDEAQRVIESLKGNTVTV